MIKSSIIIACMALAACTAPQPTYSIVQSVNGNRYVLDHGLTADDCLASLQGFGTAMQCEVER